MKQIKYGHVVNSSKILHLAWWGQREWTRVRWRADRGSEVIGRDSKGEKKKKLREGFVPARPLCPPIAELSTWILESHNPSTVVRNLFNSVTAVCVSHCLSLELLHVPGQWVPFPCRWRCQYSGRHPIISNAEIILKIMLLKYNNQKQSCTKTKTACIFDSHQFVYVWYFLCLFPLLSSSQRTNISKDQ